MRVTVAASSLLRRLVFCKRLRKSEREQPEVSRPTKVPVLDEDEVHELLHQVDEQEAGKDEDLRHGQAGVREGPGSHRGHHHLVHVGQHVGETGGEAETGRY